jgi:hypothetical protein
MITTNKLQLTVGGLLALATVFAAPATAAPSSPEPLLPNESGEFYFHTHTDRTLCYVTEDEVGCSEGGQFLNIPIQPGDGMHPNGVRLNADGTVEYLVGDLGGNPETELDYMTYTAVGWTIEAVENGTRFTNERTGRGMVVGNDWAQTF